MDWIQANRFIRRYHCTICGGTLSIYPKVEEGGYEVRCPSPGHTGFTKEESPTEAWKKGEPLPLYIKGIIEQKERRKMEQELGKEKTIELAPYIGPVRLKKVEAMKILRLIWPKAPDIEIERGALLCYTYALNPLMKHVALLKFTNRKTGEETWATVLSLQAKEIIASRKHRWSYADGPRIMKKAEQEEIFGEIDQDRLWVITILQDERGNRAPGYGCFGKTETLYGEEKGNTKFNQASTRSISQALNRLFAAEMPSGVETLDETFIEGEFKEPPLESKTKKELGVATPKKTGELPKPSDLKNLGHLYAYANEHFNLTPLQVNEILGITDKNQIADVQEAWAKILAHCQIERN